MLDLRQLRYFVAVAETERVGRAAERLHMLQSLAGRSRNSSRTWASPCSSGASRESVSPGTARSSWPKPVRYCGMLIVWRTWADGWAGEKRAACASATSPTPMRTGILPGALRALHNERPGIRIALYNLPPIEQFEGLRQRSLDIALVHEPPTADDPDDWPHPCSRTRGHTWSCRGASTRRPGKGDSRGPRWSAVDRSRECPGPRRGTRSSHRRQPVLPPHPPSKPPSH